MQVTIDLPENLAANLQSHKGKLSRIFELGLREFEASSSVGYKSVADVLEFFAGLPAPDEILGLRPSAEMQEKIEHLLAKNGYEHYETSAFCKPKNNARHNLNYWQFGDYLGIGAGAHSKLSYHDKITRETRHKHPKAFMQAAESGNASDNIWAIERKDLGFEFMLNALRLTGGFEKKLFSERTGLPWEAISMRVLAAAQKGLIAQEHNLIKPTLQGQRYLNDLLALFLD